MKNVIRKWSLFFISLFAGVLLAILASTPPPPDGLTAPLDEFSSGRAMKDVRVIASAPHPTGSVENEKVRSYLEDRLTELGMEVHTSESKLEEKLLKRLNGWRDEIKTEQPIFNVMGVLAGKDSAKPALLLMAHHDTVWGSPGAADDTIGLASILEIVRALKDTENRQRDLFVLFTDAEELEISGAIHFFNEHPLRDKIGAIINFDSRGAGGRVNLIQTSSENGSAVKLFARYVRHPSASSLATFVYSIAPNYTDLTPALEKNYTAYNFANIGKAEFYHSPKITADALDEGTLQHMGSQGLDLSRALLTADNLPTKTPNVAFFDVFGFFTISYAAYLGWGFLIIAATGYILSLKPKGSQKEIGIGFVKMLAFLILGGLSLYVLNKLSGHNSSANYYDRLAAISKLELVAVSMIAAGFFAIFGFKKTSASERFGFALPIFILGILGQVFAPIAVYFIILPLLLCGVSSLVISRWSENSAAALIVGVSATLVIGYMLFLGHMLMVAVGPDILFIAILPAAIALLAVIPLYPNLSKNFSYFLALTGLVLSIGTSIWVRIDPLASTIPLY